MITLSVGVLLPRAEAKGPGAEQLQSLLEAKSPHVVTIEAVIEREMSGVVSRSVETEQNFQGLLLDESGTILTSAFPFATSTRKDEDDELRIESKPKQLKVRVPGDSTTYEAFLGAKAAQFGLAFLKLKHPGEVSLEPVDLNQSRIPGVGEFVVGISRKAKTVKYAPYFFLTRINGSVSNPRQLWSLGEAPAAGLPVFAPDGTLLGVTVRIRVEENRDSGDPFGGILSRGSRSSSVFLTSVDHLKNVLNGVREEIKKMSEKIKKNGDTPKTY